MNKSSLLREWYSSPNMQGLLLGVVAAAGYGGWAYYSNIDYPEAATRAGLTQATMSFVSTFAVAWLMNLLFSVGKTRISKIALTVAGTTTIVGATLYSVHWLVGTPNIIKAITPSVGLGACLGSFAWALTAARVLTQRS